MKIPCNSRQSIFTQNGFFTKGWPTFNISKVASQSLFLILLQNPRVPNTVKFSKCNRGQGFDSVGQRLLFKKKIMKSSADPLYPIGRRGGFVKNPRSYLRVWEMQEMQECIYDSLNWVINFVIHNTYINTLKF